MVNSSKSTPIYKIGDIVTLKSHPLAFQKGGLIDAYVNQIPPFMCVKETHFEKKKRKFSAENENIQIADRTKYLCVYFNQYKMIFEEKFIYESMLIGLDDLLFHRKDDKPDEDDYQSLIAETKQYKPLEIEDYVYGKRIFFKTYKLEKRKSFSNIEIDYNSSKKSAVVHTSPAFIINGFKKNEEKSIYDEQKGQPIKLISKTLVKVLWYNSYQEKLSEDYLPLEFFTNDEKIYK